MGKIEVGRGKIHSFDNFAKQRGVLVHKCLWQVFLSLTVPSLKCVSLVTVYQVS